jgi:hypothetical protein
LLIAGFPGSAKIVPAWITVTGSGVWAKDGVAKASAVTVAASPAANFISVIPLIGFKSEWSRSRAWMQAP